MAGFRTFATGEVLTAANVNNFLMKQSVMVFADATARTAALGAEVAEGMLTFNKDTGALEVFDGTNFVPAGAEPPAGIGSNVVQTVKTDTFSTTSTTFVDVTGLSVTITPSSDTSKVLLIGLVNFSTGPGTAASAFIQLSGGNTSGFVGDASGNRARAMSGWLHDSSGYVSSRGIQASTTAFLDAPATTSAITYTVQLRSNSGTNVFVNREGEGVNSPRNIQAASSIIAIEVAA